MQFSNTRLTEAQNQQDIAAHDLSPKIRLIAGPGTGKSRTIINRIRFLLREGIPPRQIHVISFTNASVDDLQQKYKESFNQQELENVPEIKVSTLHSLAYTILRNSGQLPYAGRPEVLDKWEIRNVIEKEYKEYCLDHIPPINIGLKRCNEIREYFESRLYARPNYPIYYQQPDTPISDAEYQHFNVFYTQWTNLYSCILPGEIVKACLERINTGVIEPVGLLEMSHLIVDEYQDLNPVDIEFIDYFANNGVHVFICGDDDQSIYSFRYGSPLGIQDFGTRHQEQVTYNLTHCFRCTPNILQSADQLITSYHDERRLIKSVLSMYEDSNPPNPGLVKFLHFARDIDEAGFIGSFCEKVQANGFPLSEIMILLSNPSDQSALIMSELDKYNIEYYSPKDDDFVDTDLGRFILGLIRLIVDRNDYVAYRLLFGLQNQVSIPTCAQVAHIAIRNQLNYMNLFRNNDSDILFPTRINNKLKVIRDIWDRVRDWNGEDSFANRIEDIQDLIQISKGYDENIAVWNEIISHLPDEITLAELLNFLTANHADRRHKILMGVNTRLGLENERVDKVKIMSMHGAKGLDSRIVIIPGLEEKLLPKEKCNHNVGLLNEAARLLYVSITRAKGLCFVSYSDRRFIYGNLQSQVSSRFTNRINANFVKPRKEFSDEDYQGIIQAITDLF